MTTLVPAQERPRRCHGCWGHHSWLKIFCPFTRVPTERM